MEQRMNRAEDYDKNEPDTETADFEISERDAAWVGPLVVWANEHTDDLDFEGAQVPPRIRLLITSAMELGMVEGHK